MYYEAVYTQYRPVHQLALCSNSPNLMFTKYIVYMCMHYRAAA